MKSKMMLGLLILCSICAYSQKNEIRLQFHQISVLNAQEKVNVLDSSLIITPEEYDKNINFDIDFAYLRKYKGVQLFFSIGLKSISKNGELRTARGDFYSISKNLTNTKKINSALGIYHVLELNQKKININVGVLAKFQHNILSQVKFSNDAYSGNGSYLSGVKTNYTFVNSWRTGLSFNLGAYYYFSNKFGVGIENSNYLFFDYLNGITVEERIFLNQDKLEIDRIVINHKEKNTIIGKAFGFSIVLAYKF